VTANLYSEGVVMVDVALHKLIEVVHCLRVQHEIGDLLVTVKGAADFVLEVTGQVVTVHFSLTFQPQLHFTHKSREHGPRRLLPRIDEGI
jgi:hypothetical protein